MGLVGVDIVEVVKLVAAVRPSWVPSTRKGNESSAEEAWVGTNWVLSNDDGRTPRCTSGDDAGPSHSVDHQGIILAHTTSHGASTDYEGPPRMSPPVFSGSAHDGGCIFVPTPGISTPPLVHVDPTMLASSQTPHGEAVQIEQISVEDIEPVEALRRSRRLRAHAPDCGTGDGMYFVYTSHLLELLLLCI